MSLPAPGLPAPVYALAAFFCGTLSAVLMKLADGVPPGTAIALRSLVTCAALGAVVALWPMPGAAGIGRAGYLRAALDALAAITFALAVFLLPISLLASIHATLPILSVVLSALILSEPLGRRTLAAMALAFAGTLLILRPALGFSAAGLALALASVLCFALRDIVTRRLGAGLDVRKLVLVSLVLVAAGSTGLVERRDWALPDPADAALIALSGAALLGTTFLIVTALRGAAVTRIAPLRYTAVLWALVFDALLWGYLPGPWAWGGIALILAAGLLQHAQSLVKGAR
jgi:drug/metabolite transporter (DMT)-like permease